LFSFSCYIIDYIDQHYSIRLNSACYWSIINHLFEVWMSVHTCQVRDHHLSWQQGWMWSSGGQRFVTLCQKSYVDINAGRQRVKVMVLRQKGGAADKQWQLH